MRTTEQRTICAALLVLVLVADPLPAESFEISSGVSMGGILAGTVPHLAVSPHAGISRRLESGVLFEVHDLFSILLATNKDGIGVYNHTSVTIGYASEKGNFSAGPSLSIYSMPACGMTWCGRVAGLSPGGHVQANVYLAGPWGVWVSANVDWIGGSSLVLPGGVATMVVSGPVFRWSSKGDPMKTLLWSVVIAVPTFAACNYTVGECYPVGQGEGTSGAGGGGVLIPGGTGGLGNTPSGSGGTRISEADCNSKPQEPAAPEMPGNAYINCKARGLSPGACSLACGEVGAACGAVAAHPYKSGQGTGQLTYCKNGWPSTTCTYTFANTDSCVLITLVGANLTWRCIYAGG